MKLHSLCLTGALIATAIPLSAKAVPAAADHEAGSSARQAALATYTCPLDYYWDRTPMPRTIACPAGE